MGPVLTLITSMSLDWTESAIIRAALPVSLCIRLDVSDGVSGSARLGECIKILLAFLTKLWCEGVPGRCTELATLVATSLTLPILLLHLCVSGRGRTLSVIRDAVGTSIGSWSAKSL